MKLIVSGATGFVAAEVIHQGLAHPKITQVIALSRRAVQLGAKDDKSKFKQVLVKDYGDYPEDVLQELKGANACIWTASITPTKSRLYNFEDVKRINQTSKTNALRAMISTGVAEPFRFILMSGEGVDPEKPANAPLGFGPFVRLACETETQIRVIGDEHKGQVEVGIARPALITSNASIWRTVWGTLLRGTNATQHVGRDECAAAMIEQVVNGFEKPVLTNGDLKRIGGEVLQRQSLEST